MRNIIYFIAAGIIGLFSACQDITIGYLESDTAKYTIDTLHILNVNKELQRLKATEADFYENNKELQDEVKLLAQDTLDLHDQWGEELDEALIPIWDEMDEAIDNDDYDKLDELTELQLQIQEDFEIKYRALIDAIKDEMDEKNEELENLAADMGIGSLAILQKQITDYQEKVDYKLPWASPKIEGVQGTQPLLFSVIGVTSDNAEAAAKFMEYVGVLGDGTIYVDQNVDVSPGNYAVSLKIENEGRTRILENIFTFIMDAEDNPNTLAE